MRQIFFDMGYVSLFLFLRLLLSTFAVSPLLFSRKPRIRKRPEKGEKEWMVRAMLTGAHQLDSLKCRLLDSLNLLSGISILCSFPNNTQRGRFRILSTLKVGLTSFLSLFPPSPSPLHPSAYSHPSSYLALICKEKRALTPDPPKAGRPDEEYYQRVAKVHESGGYGSIGYRAPFSRDDSERLLLRTHTTAVSTNMLYKIANQPGGFKPAKMFYIDRVFRYVT